MSTLENHFTQKFAHSKATPSKLSDAITAADERVKRKYKSLCDAFTFHVRTVLLLLFINTQCISAIFNAFYKFLLTFMNEI